MSVADGPDVDAERGPAPASGGSAPINRREALRLLAVGMAAGVAGCKPAEDIVPYVVKPEGLTTGVPLRFATSLPLGGYARGVLATSHDGRPTKISGNPLHPASLGATDVFCEADILGLYDPERTRAPRRGHRPESWEAFHTELRPRLAGLAARGGEGLTILTGRVTSPTLLRQIEALRAGPFPRMRWRRYEPLGDDNARAGSVLAFGRRLDILAHLGRADIVLSLAADPLGHGPDQIRNAQGFRERRTVRGGRADMQRLYVVESAMTLTGAMADHRLALAPGDVADFAGTLADALRAGGSEPAAATRSLHDAVLADLRAAGSRALVLVGEEQPPELHALGAWINHALGAFGTTLDLVEPVDPHPEGHGESIANLAQDLRGGGVDTLLILGGNPVYDAPADLNLADALANAGFSAHLGTHRNETAVACHWHLPESHPLEAWSDLRSVDGTAGIVQPLIVPLYATRTAHEVLASLGGTDASVYDIVRETWAADSGPDFEPWWRQAVHDGVVPGSAAVPVSLAAAPQPPLRAAPPAITDGLTLLFRPDPSVWDGRYAGNAWLQECPKPVTHEAWGNALRLSPADAGQLGLADGDAVRLDLDGRSLEAPLLVDSGQAEGVALLSLGYGRSEIGAIGLGLGANAYAIRTSGASWIAQGLQLTRLGRAEEMPRTQLTLDEHGRDIAPEISLEDILAGVRLSEAVGEPPTLYPKHPYERPYEGPKEDYAWAMVIDTTLCIGCNACVIACQSENNVPVVGPDEIRAGRSMHWLRIDAYEKPRAGAPQPIFQPVPCMQCEKAPCEPVCPVAASVHDHEGLNVQVYNRCVGTRFCQANCPYKVRRFNFFGYADGQEYANMGEPPLEARLNPDVTVRGRGVMEKCTYCVQRISGARREAEKEGRRIGEGEVVTACAAACPTRAIQFGDLNADGSNVLALRHEPQHHVLLEELGTRPRTTYLARVRNESPDIEEGGA